MWRLKDTPRRQDPGRFGPIKLLACTTQRDEMRTRVVVRTDLQGSQSLSGNCGLEHNLDCTLRAVSDFLAALRLHTEVDSRRDDLIDSNCRRSGVGNSDRKRLARRPDWLWAKIERAWIDSKISAIGLAEGNSGSRRDAH